MVDDNVAAVQIGDGSVRGRIIRMGPALDTALGQNRYPVPVARLLGEAVLISGLVARSLKFDGKLLVQATGTNEGAVSMIVAESTTDGHVRAYARYDQDSLDRITAVDTVPGADMLMSGGESGGTFAMTIDQGPDMDRYQGLAAIEGQSLAACAEHYFRQSEQIPTRLQLAVGQLLMPGQEAGWRGGGLMVQRIAGDRARSETEDAWDLSRAVMSTVSDEELLDPDLATDHLLYRLFHEMGVQRANPDQILARCSCSRDRLHETLVTFDRKDREDMLQDGNVTANCEFCATDYIFTKEDLGL
ncbi:MAG: molecular chaperone Hsp33 [Hyphomonadaceae bacterium]|nr:molecular chaperone Hsp33 [Hyphomonadaceae bacterium]